MHPVNFLEYVLQNYLRRWLESCADLVNRTGNIYSCSTSSELVYFGDNEKSEIVSIWPKLEFYYLDQNALLCGDKNSMNVTLFKTDTQLFLMHCISICFE